MKRLDKILQEALVEYNILSETEVKDHTKAAQSNNETLKEYLLLNDISA